MLFPVQRAGQWPYTALSDRYQELLLLCVGLLDTKEFIRRLVEARTKRDSCDAILAKLMCVPDWTDQLRRQSKVVISLCEIMMYTEYEHPTRRSGTELHSKFYFRDKTIRIHEVVVAIGPLTNTDNFSRGSRWSERRPYQSLDIISRKGNQNKIYPVWIIRLLKALEQQSPLTLTPAIRATQQ